MSFLSNSNVIHKKNIHKKSETSDTSEKLNNKKDAYKNCILNLLENLYQMDGCDHGIYFEIGKTIVTNISLLKNINNIDENTIITKDELLSILNISINSIKRKYIFNNINQEDKRIAINLNLYINYLIEFILTSDNSIIKKIKELDEKIFKIEKCIIKKN